MKRSIVHLARMLKAKQLEFPALVSSLERKEFSFMQDLVSWIKHTEQILADNNNSGAAELSGLRSRILAPRFSDERRASTKKLQLKIAAEVLYDVQHAVALELGPIEARVEEARVLVRQLLAIVAQSGAVVFDAAKPFEMFIDEIWRFVGANDQLKAGAIKLRSSLPSADIPILIADEVNTEDFVPPPVP